ncbi:TIGR03986 family CRISPR-associated RAMP protein [Reyranella sp.]|uniref:TIGR03986 family type III CRISPR-associated RAMP protein n=1 Tax=Reyranella sp. TaxID=1929291 RepID=UPI0025DDE562|nr:TIGR03986 family CRISPR-associated RAMP protein [Reyranella sp.]
MAQAPHHRNNRRPGDAQGGRQNQGYRPQGGGGAGEQAAGAVLHAPYNFVPLSAFVHAVPWADQISHDWPFKDGLSGWFDLSIETHAPLLVGGRQTKDERGRRVVHAFRLGDRHAIPASSLRGMVRNVLEIAGFGRMKLLDDRRFGIRDLNESAKPYYRDRLTESWGASPPIQVKHRVRAGWLSANAGGGYTIQPCDVARVYFSELEKLSRSDGLSPIAKSAWEQREQADERYRKWGNRPRVVEMVVGQVQPHRHQGGSIEIHYARASAPTGGEAALTKGTLVFTGKTKSGSGPGDKKQEFFFFDARPAPPPLDVSPEVFRGFRTIHDPVDNSAGKNPAWKHWEPVLKQGQPIPVFFIADPATQGVASFGLAQMFKLAHELSVHQMLGHTTRDGDAKAPHLQGATVDFATALFGVEGRSKDDVESPPGLRGRVTFEPAMRADGGTDEVPLGPTILLGAKGSYFPAYVRQPAKAGAPRRLDGATYATYTPLPGRGRAVAKPEISGWKRYPARPFGGAPPVPDNVANSFSVQSSLHAVPKGKVFSGRVHFHNLKPIELGALLWTLEWGGEAGLRHALGTGRPFGMGQIAVRAAEIGDSDANGRPRTCVIANDPGGQATAAAYRKADLVALFEKHMESAFAAAKAGVGWAASEQIVSLLAMADPEMGARLADTPDQLEHMVGAQAYARAKQAKPPLVLAPYPDLVGKPVTRRETAAFPRSPVVAAPQSGTGAKAAASGLATARPWQRGDRMITRDGDLFVLDEEVRTGQAKVRGHFEDNGSPDTLPVSELKPR